ncbi:hypothetical protein [Streptomyces sp. SD31]|uniref:hypothetical protein n=1 Tax=Streptomyces sp. SD31 TaxID=3452208 RepID=UPI003F8953AC
MLGDRLLRAAGLTPATDIHVRHLPMPSAARAMRDGAVDALLVAGGVPLPVPSGLDVRPGPGCDGPAFWWCTARMSCFDAARTAEGGRVFRIKDLPQEQPRRPAGCWPRMRPAPLLSGEQHHAP